MNKRKLINNRFLILLLSVSFYQCYEPVEDCLDPLATNYNVSADNPCDDCCTNPELQLNFRLLYNGSNVSKDSWIEYAPGDTVAIQSLEMAFSDFSMLDSDFNQLNSEETFTYESNTYFKDFSFINSAAQNITALSFKYIGQINEVAFALGIPQTIQNPNVNIEIPILEEIQDSLWDASNEEMAKFKFRYILKDSILQEDLVLLDLDDEKLRFAVDTLTQKAVDLNYTLNFNIDYLWNGIDFKTDSQDDIRSTLETNLIGSFELE